MINWKVNWSYAKKEIYNNVENGDQSVYNIFALAWQSCSGLCSPPPLMNWLVFKMPIKQKYTLKRYCNKQVWHKISLFYNAKKSFGPSLCSTLAYWWFHLLECSNISQHHASGKWTNAFEERNIMSTWRLKSVIWPF